MRRQLTAAAVATATGLASFLAASTSPATAATPIEYVVVAEDGVAPAAAIAAIQGAGGSVVARNDAAGMYTVKSGRGDFRSKATADAQLIGVTQKKAMGYAPSTPKLEQPHQGPIGSNKQNAGLKADPLDDKLWGLEMIHADQAHAIESGDRGVTVGVLDTGLDASNPDLAPHFSQRLSRNFAPDMTDIDGPCEVAGCLDPVGTDDGGHGTHVAGTIGAAANGVGVSGVAPNVTLVELKGGQDSGYFFLEPVVNALVYAGDAGIDVVNMSFYVDPWLYDCRANPADSPEQQAEQRAIIAGMRRALNYAHNNGVTLFAALGNANQDLGKPPVDRSSPDYPEGVSYPRTIDNDTCWDLPVEGPHVIGVSAVGPSGNRSYFSNYGVEQISVAAPGGAFTDGSSASITNEILSTFPKNVLQSRGWVDADGNVVPARADSVFKSCTKAGVCGYYTYLQGTSMASPHAAGVAALIASRFGEFDGEHGGKTMKPNAVERKLITSAAERPCPAATPACEGTTEFNGFYGNGIVDAYRAVR
ncbi:S8 family serine peptidase [Actinoplanes sp. NBRC 103695]|uniref:S8 family serine peptidase n=1 Tax=Actinoplanes sp. NBRC 103695 TaxID=3032202 RepID=UPI0024A59159|nr:S8 family serine peptidase [Actinoplanes sp. NBRC 103695]GLY96628.1 serine protease [Actinoplanes sp. NBRC 103695]